MARYPGATSTSPFAVNFSGCAAAGPCTISDTFVPSTFAGAESVAKNRRAIRLYNL